MNRFTTCGKRPQCRVKTSALMAAFLLVLLLGCGTTEPSETTIVGTWAITQVTNGGVAADSVAGQWTFRADGTQSGWSFMRLAFDVDRVWSGDWNLNGSTLHVFSVFTVPVAPPGFDPPSSAIDYAVTFAPSRLVLSWGPDSIGDIGTLVLVRR